MRWNLPPSSNRIFENRAGAVDEDPTPEEIEAMQAEVRAFRNPAPPPIPVRGRFYLIECEDCGWVGSSEQCGDGGGPAHDDIVCPVCCNSIAGDTPSESDTAKHGEAVMQRLRTLEAEVARLRAALECPTPEMIAAAWDAWKARHGGKLGPGPGFREAIQAAGRALVAAVDASPTASA